MNSVTALSPELQFLKHSIETSAETIREIARENRRKKVCDEVSPELRRARDQAASYVIKAFRSAAFWDPVIGKVIGSFAATSVEEFCNDHWQAAEVGDLLRLLTKNFWYEKQLDSAIAYEREDDSRLTETGAIDRWYQETADVANMLVYLAALTGVVQQSSVQVYRSYLTSFEPVSDFQQYEKIFEAIGAISCQEHWLLKYFNCDSRLLTACMPYQESLDEFNAVVDSIGIELKDAESEKRRNKKTSTGEIWHDYSAVLGALNWFLALTEPELVELAKGEAGPDYLAPVAPGWKPVDSLVQLAKDHQPSLALPIEKSARHVSECYRQFKEDIEFQIAQDSYDSVSPMDGISYVPPVEMQSDPHELLTPESNRRLDATRNEVKALQAHLNGILQFIPENKSDLSLAIEMQRDKESAIAANDAKLATRQFSPIGENTDWSLLALECYRRLVQSDGKSWWLEIQGWSKRLNESWQGPRARMSNAVFFIDDRKLFESSDAGFKLLHFDPYTMEESETPIVSYRQHPIDAFDRHSVDNRLLSKNEAVAALERLINFNRASEAATGSPEKTDEVVLKKIIVAYMGAKGTASQKESAVMHLIKPTKWQHYKAVKARAGKLGITQKRIKNGEC